MAGTKTVDNSLGQGASLLEFSLAGPLALDDESEFRLFYRRHVSKVRSLLVRLSGNAFLDDLTQEVFLRIWRARSQLRSDSATTAWICRIAVHVTSDHFRSRKNRPFAALSETELAGRDPSAALEAKGLVAAGLAMLDLPHRAALVLHDVEGLNEAEVGEALGIPRGTVKSRLFNARRRMREFLEMKGVTP